MAINYVKGDATNPVGEAPRVKIIVHVCNDIGAWGAGFVLAISKKWKEPEQQYRSIPKDKLNLGMVQFVQVKENLVVANMIAQHNIGFDKTNGTRPIRYTAIEECLNKVYEAVKTDSRMKNASVHMPRIGCGLAGGTWDRVEPIVAATLKELDVYVYDLV